MPTPPDWLMTEMPPRSNSAGRKLPLKPAPVWIKPRVLGPRMFMSSRCARARISRSRAAPAASVSLKPALMTTTLRMPAAAQARRYGSTRSRFTAIQA